MSLKTDVGIIGEHFAKTACYLVAETLLRLFLLWNPARFSPGFVTSIESAVGWFMVATMLLFSVTCLALLVRSSVRALVPPREFTTPAERSKS